MANTCNARHPGWATLEDIGNFDEDGYLFLTDRKDYMILSGRRNVYLEKDRILLISHPNNADRPVIGVPDPEMGEAIKAVVQTAELSEAGPALEAELVAYCRVYLSHLECPRSVEFDPKLPRYDAGKIYKRLIQDRYWVGHDKRNSA